MKSENYVKNNLRLALVKLSQDINEPLNLLEISAYLKKKIPSIDIKIIDRAYDNIIKELILFQPDIVGISAMTVEYPLSIKLCNRIKSSMNIPVIIGGIHISCLPNSFDRCFDLGILGEAEIPLYKILNNFMREGKIGLDYFKKNRRYNIV